MLAVQLRGGRQFNEGLQPTERCVAGRRAVELFSWHFDAMKLHLPLQVFFA